QQRAPCAASPPGAGAPRPGPGRLGHYRGPRTPGCRQAGPPDQRLRLPPSVRDLGRAGRAGPVPERYQLRAARSGRHPVARPEPQVAINPEDAASLGLATGDEVRVTSRRGDLTGVANVTSEMRKGEIFVPFVRIKDSAANFLTNAAYDPSSQIPEYKVCAVRL